MLCLAALMTLLLPKIGAADFARQTFAQVSVNSGLSKAYSDIREPTSIALSRDGSLLGAIDRSGHLYIADTSSDSAKDLGSVGTGDSKIAFSPTGDKVAALANGALFLADTKTSEFVKIPHVEGGASSLTFSQEGLKLAAGGFNGTVTVVDVPNAQIIATIHAGKGHVLLANFDPSGQGIVVLTNGDKKIRGYNIESPSAPTFERSVTTQMKDHDPDFTDLISAAATPDGTIIAVGGKRQFANHGFGLGGGGGFGGGRLGGGAVSPSDVNSMSSHDLGALESGSFIKLIDRSGTPLGYLTYVDSEDADRAVSITGDGRYVVSAIKGGYRLWPTHGGNVINEPDRSPGRFSAAADLGARYCFAIADSAAQFVVLDSDPPRSLPDSAAKGLTANFLAPAEAYPVVDSPVVQLALLVKGATPGAKVKIRLAGKLGSGTDVTLLDQKRIRYSGAAPDAEDTASPPIATQIGPEGIEVMSSLRISKGPNRVEIEIADGQKSVQLSKLICYVPSEDEGVQSTNGVSRAVVIGVDTFKNPDISPLKYACADAEAVGGLLKTRFGFSDVTVLKNEAATAKAIYGALQDLTDSSKVHPEDRVIVFFSGHGQGFESSEGGRIGYLIPFDANIDFRHPENREPYLQTCVSMLQLQEYARAIPAKHVLFLLDACFSGIGADAAPGYPDILLANPKYKRYFEARQILTASSSNETALEGKVEGAGHGYFTQALLDELGATNSPIEVTDLFSRIRPKIQKLNPNQNPRQARFTESPGEMIFTPAGG